MRIRVSFIIFCLTALSLTAVVAGIDFVSSGESFDAAQKSMLARDIVRAMSYRREVVEKYLRDRREETALAWKLMHDATERLLADPLFETAEERAILLRMREHNARADRLFVELMDAKKVTRVSLGGAVAPLVSELIEACGAIAEGAFGLASEVSRHHRQTLIRRNVVISISGAVLVLLMLGGLSAVNFWIVRPLLSLEREVQRIGAGEPALQVQTRMPVELRRLAVALSQTTRRLREAAEESQSRAQHLALAEERLLRSLEQKEALLREVNHRVKNNLNVVSGLLGLQSARMRDPVTRAAFFESQNRVLSMAMVHEKLCQSENLTRIDFESYVRTLVFGIYAAYGADPKVIEPCFAIEDAPLNLDTALPCSLIVNELVSNSLKYAFHGRRNGRILISLRRTTGGEAPGRELIVRDDGRGMPRDFEFGQCRSLGLQLVKALARQLRGEATFRRPKHRGTSFEVRFQRSVEVSDA